MKKIIFLFLTGILVFSLQAKPVDNFKKDYKKYRNKKKLSVLNLECRMLYHKLMSNYDAAFQDLTLLIKRDKKKQDFYWRILYALKDNCTNILAYRNFLNSFITSHPNNEMAQYLSLKENYKIGRVSECYRLREKLNFITNFLAIGPFDNEKGAGLDTPYPPEFAYSFTNNYKGKLRTVTWRTLFSSPIGRIKPDNFFRPYKETTGYFSVFLYVPKTESGNLKLSINTPVKIWVNHDLLYDNKDKHDIALDQFTIPLTLTKGWNYLLLKSANPAQSQWMYMLRLSGFDNNIKQSLNPCLIDEIDFNLTESQSEQNNQNDVLSYMSSLTNKKKNKDFHFFNLGYYSYLLQTSDINDNIPGYYFSKALDLNDKYSLYFYYMAMAQRGTRYPKKYWEKSLSLNPELIEPHVQLMNYYASLGYEDNLIENLNKLLQIPSLPVMLFALKYYSEKNYLTKTKNVLKIGEERNINNTDFFYYKALYYLRINSYFKTIDALKQSLNLESYNYKSRNLLVHLYKKNSEYEKAEAILKKSRLLYPDSIELYEKSADLVESKGDYTNALTYLKKAEKICPEDFYVVSKIGKVFHQLNQETNAEIYLKKANKLKPNNHNLKKYIDFLYPSTNILMTYNKTIDDVYNKQKYKDTEVLLNQQVTEVYQDGTASSLVHIIVQLNTEKSIEEFQKRNLFFNPKSEKIEILKARVYDSSLNYIEADEVGEYSYGGAQAYLFYDLKYKHIVFPKLHKGVIVELEYLHHITKNIFGNYYFGDSFTFGDFYNCKNYSYILIADKSKKLYTHIQNKPNFKIKKTKTLMNEKQILTFSATNVPKTKKEFNMPPIGFLAPVLIVSTLNKWHSFGKWLTDLFKDQLKEDDFIKAKVKDLTDGLDNTDAKIIAINQFIVSQIRYIGLEFGLNAIQPRPVSQILSTGYGDCKEKASLMVAMLKQINVPAYVALVRTHQKGHSDFKFPYLGAFDHAICYVDYKGGFFLDGTADFYSYKNLPYSDHNEPMFILDGKKSRFIAPPKMQAFQNKDIVHSDIIIKKDGSALLKRFVEKIGQSAAGFRYYFQSLNNQEQYLNRYWNQMYPGAVVKNIKFSSLTDLSINPTVSYDVKIPEYVNTNNTSYIPGIPIMQPLTASYTPDSSRRVSDLDLPYPWSLEETVKIILPDNYEPSELLSPKSATNQYLNYAFSMQKNKKQITITNSLVLKKHVVPAIDYKSLRSTLIKLDSLQNTKIYLIGKDK